MVVKNTEGKDITLRGILLCGTADAPAKCLMQNFVQFNGFNGCPYCMEPGKTVKTSARGHTHAYPFNRGNPLKGYETERTHENTLQHAYDAHKSKLEGKYSPVFGVKGYSWFMFIPGFDIIKGISVDYMHCVLLGVTKMLLTLWFDKTHVAEEWNVSKRLDEVERRLLNITPPNCISRTPRSIVKDFSHWKASEFRSFLFFYGIPCLWNILPDEYFQHFILLVEAIWLLDQISVSPECLQKAHNLLRHFCLRIEALYGSRYETFNVHCLLHLHDCVKNIGPLWACSCFWYEDCNGDLRRLFHGTNKVELQIAFSVCVQQKIPELIPLLPHGSATKEFYEHMTQARYSLKCKREEISHNVFALGVMSPAALSAVLTHSVESNLRARISRVFSFKRIQVNRDIIHSKSYLNISRRNSCTVYVNDLGFVEVKLYLKVFVECQNALFCSDLCSCKQPSYFGIADCCLRPAADITLSSDNFTNCEPGHIIPVKRENCSNVIFPVTSLVHLSGL
ncbi:uncharacterized protein LOC114974471 [Acropora millepora]|uniref:uncharacterized protein LOC114974471 n=1 Tax=Acropora millepora TaxID=45264 RepID=UPI001CF2F712|nr:uncharacterized protein LOC114974471 [Acropora millepora]